MIYKTLHIKLFLWNICIRNYHRYVPLVVNTSRSFPHSWSITGFVTRLTRQVEQRVGTAHHSGAPEFTPGFSGVRVTRSLVLCVMFCRSLFVLSFSFCHCAVCPSIYGFWLRLWYLQTLHILRLYILTT